MFQLPCSVYVIWNEWGFSSFKSSQFPPYEPKRVAFVFRSGKSNVKISHLKTRILDCRLHCASVRLLSSVTSVQCFLAATLASVRLCAALPIRLQSRLQSSIAPYPPQPVSASFSLCTDMRICVIWTVGCINLFFPRLPQRDSDPSSLPPFSSPPLPSLSFSVSEELD